MKNSVWIGSMLAVALALSACSGAQGAAPNGAPSGDTAAGNTAQQNPANGAGNSPDAAGGQQNPVATLSTDAETAITDLNKLTVGVLYLQDNQPGSITTEQASALLVTYQDIQTAIQAARDANAANFPTPSGDQQGGPGGGPGGNGVPPGDGTPLAGMPGGNGGGPGGSGGPGFAGGRGGSDVFRVLAQADLGKAQQYASTLRAAFTAEQLAVIDALTDEQMSATLETHGVGFAQGGQPPADFTPGAQPDPQSTPDPDQMATFQAQGGPGQGGRANNPLLDEVIAVLTAITGS